MDDRQRGAKLMACGRQELVLHPAEAAIGDIPDNDDSSRLVTIDFYGLAVCLEVGSLLLAVHQHELHGERLALRRALHRHLLFRKRATVFVHPTTFSGGRAKYPVVGGIREEWLAGALHHDDGIPHGNQYFRVAHSFEIGTATLIVQGIREFL
jgi:hypothetical protein